MVVSGKHGRYAIVRKIASNGRLSYYSCTDSHSQMKILAVATSIENNAEIERIQFALKMLAEKSRNMEELYHLGTDPDADENIRSEGEAVKLAAKQLYAEALNVGKIPESGRLHYDWLFPIVLDSFKLTDQGNRSVLVLDFLDVDLKAATPFVQLSTNNLRVDPKTSAWIMGRFLKLLGFLNVHDVQLPLDGERFLLEPDTHRLLMLDWTQVSLDSEMTEAQISYTIRKIAQTMLLLLGARRNPSDSNDWAYDYFSSDEEEGHKERKYLYHLMHLATAGCSNADIAHREFYKVVDSVWERKFHPFTTYPKVKEG